MEIYLLNYILIIIEAAIFQLVPKLKKHNKAFLNIAFLQLFILLALRKDNIATDLETYKRVFFEISNTSWENVFNIAWEPLFIILCKVVVTLFNNFNVLLVIVALIGLIGPYSFIKRYSKNYYISVILFVGLYFYSSQFFILRQIIAISFLLNLYV